MITVLSYTFLAIFLLSFTTQLGYVKAEVKVLTDKNFDANLGEGRWMIKFYAPWCGHCKSMAPAYAKLSDATDLDTGVKIGKVDCTTEKEICSRLPIHGFPTLKVFEKGYFYDYVGKREFSEMKEFVNKAYATSIREKFLSKDEFDNEKAAVEKQNKELKESSKVVSLEHSSFEELVLKKKDSAWFLKLYAPWCGHCKRLAPTWDQLSISIDHQNVDVKIGKFKQVDCTLNRRVCSRLGVTSYPHLLYVRNGEMYEYNGRRIEKDFIEFLSSGWKSAKSKGPILEEGYLSTVVDTLLDWGYANPIIGITSAILVFAMLLMCLMSCLDFMMGDEMDEELKQCKPGVDMKKVDGENKAD